MALEGTHIRFALEMKDKYQVQDLAKYLSGVIYPDSRYVTKVDRLKTHPDEFMDWDILKLDDFKKGWYAHLLYDRLQYIKIRELIPDVESDGSKGQYTESWVRASAVKTLQDLDDIQRFDLKSYLYYLDYIENPNGEDLEKLKLYNKNFQDAYMNPPSIENSIQMWLHLGVPKEYEDRIRVKAIEYNQNLNIMNAILLLYDETLKMDTASLKTWRYIS